MEGQTVSEELLDNEILRNRRRTRDLIRSPRTKGCRIDDTQDKEGRTRKTKDFHYL